VSLGQGCGGGNSAALVSAWLPKRIRIALMAWSSCVSCIFFGDLPGQDAGEEEVLED
jgi:hypothetical protein